MTNPCGRNDCPHFIVMKARAQKGTKTCPKSLAGKWQRQNLTRPSGSRFPTPLVTLCHVQYFCVRPELRCLGR